MPSYDNHYVTIQTFWLRDTTWVGYYREVDVCVGKDVTKGAYDANDVMGVRPSMNIDLLSDSYTILARSGWSGLFLLQDYSASSRQVKSQGPAGLLCCGFAPFLFCLVVRFPVR